MKELKRSYVHLEAPQIVAEALVEPQTWNGYAKPFFSLFQVLEIIQTINRGSGQTVYETKVDDKGNLFVRYALADECFEEVEKIDYNDGYPYYGFGNGSLTWIELKTIGELFSAIYQVMKYENSVILPM